MLYVCLHAPGFRPTASLPIKGSATRARIRTAEHYSDDFLEEVRLVR